MDPEQRARDIYNAGGGSYPSVAPAAATPGTGWPAPGLLPDARERIAEAPDEVVQPADPAAVEDAALAALERAELLYPPQTSGMVDWNEPAAQPADYQLEAPLGVLDTSPAGKEAMERLREGFAAAGAGRTLAAELFQDAVRAQQSDARPMSQASAEAELRREWGGRYEAKVRSAAELVQRAAQRSPEIITFLQRTGLGNSPDFIRKVAAAAARATARGKR